MCSSVSFSREDIPGMGIDEMGEEGMGCGDQNGRVMIGWDCRGRMRWAVRMGHDGKGKKVDGVTWDRSG
jgi:hypothetical protein